MAELVDALLPRREGRSRLALEAELLHVVAAVVVVVAALVVDGWGGADASRRRYRVPIDAMCRKAGTRLLRRASSSAAPRRLCGTGCHTCSTVARAPCSGLRAPFSSARRPPARWRASRAQAGPRHVRGGPCAAPGHGGASQYSWRAAARSPRGPRRWPRGLRWWCRMRRGRQAAAATRCPRVGEGRKLLSREEELPRRRREGGTLLRPRPRRRWVRCACPPPPLWARWARHLRGSYASHAAHPTASPWAATRCPPTCCRAASS